MRITRKYGDCMADGGAVKKKKRKMKKPESGGKPKRITTPGKPGDSGPGGAHPGRNREKKANGGLAGGMRQAAGAQRSAVARAKPAAAKPAGGGYGSRMRQASGQAQSAMGRNRPAAAKPAAARPPRPVRGAQRRADGGKIMKKKGSKKKLPPSALGTGLAQKAGSEIKDRQSKLDKKIADAGG